MTTDETIDAVRGELFPDARPAYPEFAFTYLTGGDVGICRRGHGLVLNVSSGWCGQDADVEPFARKLAFALNAS